MKFRPLAFDYHTEAAQLISEKRKRKEESIIWIQPTLQEEINSNDEAPASSEPEKRRGESTTVSIDDWEIEEDNKLTDGAAKSRTDHTETVAKQCFPPNRTMIEEADEKRSIEGSPRILTTTMTPAPLKRLSSALAIVTHKKITKESDSERCDENEDECRLEKFFRSPENSSEWKEAMLSMALDACEAAAEAEEQGKEEIGVFDKSAEVMDEVVLDPRKTKNMTHASGAVHDEEVPQEGPSNLDKEEAAVGEIMAVPKVKESTGGDERIDHQVIVCKEKDDTLPSVQTESAHPVPSPGVPEQVTKRHHSIDLPDNPEGEGRNPMENGPNERQEAPEDDDNAALNSISKIETDIVVVEQVNEEVLKEEEKKRNDADGCAAFQVEVNESTAETTNGETIEDSTAIEKKEVPIEAPNPAAANDDGGSQAPKEEINRSGNNKEPDTADRLVNEDVETPTALPSSSESSPQQSLSLQRIQAPSRTALSTPKECDNVIRDKGDSPSRHKMKGGAEPHGSQASLKGLESEESVPTTPHKKEQLQANAGGVPTPVPYNLELEGPRRVAQRENVLKEPEDPPPSLLAAAEAPPERLAVPPSGALAALPPMSAAGTQQESNAMIKAAGAGAGAGDNLTAHAEETEERSVEFTMATSTAEPPRSQIENTCKRTRHSEDTENEVQQPWYTPSTASDESSLKRKLQNQPAQAYHQKRQRIQLGGESGASSGSAAIDQTTLLETEQVENATTPMIVKRKPWGTSTVATRGSVGVGGLDMNESFQVAEPSKRPESEDEAKPHHGELYTESIVATSSSKIDCFATIATGHHDSPSPNYGMQQTQSELVQENQDVIAEPTAQEPFVLADNMGTVRCIDKEKGDNLAVPIHHPILEETNKAVSTKIPEFRREDDSEPILQHTLGVPVNQEGTQQEAGEETAFSGENIHAHSVGHSESKEEEEEKRRRKKERKRRKKEKKERKREKRRKRQRESLSVKVEPTENDEIVCLGVRHSPKEPMVKDVSIPRAVSSWAEPKPKKAALDPSILMKPVQQSHVTINANNEACQLSDPNPNTEPQSKVNGIIQVPGSGSECTKASVNRYASMPPVKLLCSVRFLEEWGEVFTELSTGRWTSAAEQGTLANTPITCGRKFAFVDIEFLTVDVELPCSTGMIIESLSAWGEDARHSKALTSNLIKLAATERYKSLHVFLVCNLDISDVLSKQILKNLQNAFAGQDCPVRVHVQLSSVVALSYCIARAILPTLKSEEMTHYQQTMNKLPEDGVAKDGILSRASFLSRLLPTLNAISSMQLINNTGQSNSPEQFRLLFQSQIARSKMSATLPANMKSMLQLTHVIRAPLSQNQNF